MSKNPLVLTLMFLLELALLAALGYWGWTQHTGILQILLAIGAPLLAAALWGIFRVPGEPGDAVVAVRGWVRLLLELGLFALAVILLASAGQTTAAAILGVLVLLEYAVSYDRIRRFMTKKIGVACLEVNVKTTIVIYSKHGVLFEAMPLRRHEHDCQNHISGGRGQAYWRVARH